MDNTYRCGNCKYRGKQIQLESLYNDETYQYDNSGYFVCDQMKHGIDYSSSSSDRVFVAKEQPMAYVEDGSGYHAALCVSSDFACNQWEAGN